MSFAEESAGAKSSRLLSGDVKELVKPIVVYGAGRSGSTIFHSLFCRHPQVTWMSGLCQRYPRKPYYNRVLMQMLDTPGSGTLVRKRFKAFENYPFWEHYCAGFTEPCRDLKANDLTERSRKGLREALEQVVSAKRPRLLAKMTGWPRLGLLHELHDDVKFIHVLRDGRAVANSIMNVNFWRGWQGPENWRWGPLPAAYEEEWLMSGKSFVVLAGIQWKMLMDAAEAAKENVPEENALEIKYEDVCEDALTQFQHCVAFCELEGSDSFNRFVAGQNLRAANYKWKEALSTKQQSELEKCLEGHLGRYGYK